MMTPEILAVSAGALIFFVFVVLILGRRRKLKLSERLSLDKEQLLINSMIKTAEIEGNITGKEQQLSWFDRKSKELLHSGAGITMPIYVGIAIVSSLAIFLIVQHIVQLAVVSLFFSLLGLLLPNMYVKSRVEKNIKFFNTHLVKALRRMAASMRSGSTVVQAMTDVVAAKLLHPVIRAEFRKVLTDIEYGNDIEEAFYKLYERTGSKDVRFLAMTIEIKRRHGGSIGLTFEQVGSIISNRYLMEADIRATLAQANATVMLLSAIPFVLSGALMLLNPGYFEPLLASTMGRIVFLMCYVMIFVGAIIMKRMSKIRM